MARTIKIPLRVSKQKREILEEGIRRQKEVADQFNKVIESHYGERKDYSQYKLGKSLPGRKGKGMYGYIRNEFPENNGLHRSHYLTHAIGMKILENYVNWKKDGEPGTKPEYRWNRFEICNCAGDNINYDMENEGVQIGILEEEDPVWFKMRIAGFQRKRFEEAHKIGSEAKIVKINGRYELHQPVNVCEEKEEDEEYEPESYVGIDFNFDKLAFACFLDSEGNVETVQSNDYGRELREYRERHREKRRELQEEGYIQRVIEDKNTVEEYTNKTLHIISKNIVEKASEMEKPVIRIEDTDIQQMRKDENRKEKNNFKSAINRFPVAKLKDYIEYKAEEEGIPVEKVEPEYTSKGCHKCTEIGKRDGRDFYCQNEDCENYQRRIDADMNASLNIAKKTEVGE